MVRYEELVAARPEARERELRRIVNFLYGPQHTRSRLAEAGHAVVEVPAGLRRIEVRVRSIGSEFESESWLSWARV